jgi:SAM-dependent methyltransferase
MDFGSSFQRYLTAKRTVDDRALNQRVWKALEERLTALEGLPGIDIIELGGGVGTMFERMVEWGLLSNVRYTLVDEANENIRAARDRITAWAGRQGLRCAVEGDQLHLKGTGSDFHFVAREAEMGAFLRAHEGRQWDLLVAHAFLDLLDVPKALPWLRSALKPGGLMYLTINFDGLTAFEPLLDFDLDERIVSLYHRSMDERVTGGQPSGDSRTGRRLFTWLPAAGLRILEAGSSDWTVYATDGRYRGDEAYFLRFILGFFWQSLRDRPELERGELEGWLAARLSQIEHGELVFIAHQIDFLVQADG